jgi:acyl carrier protein
MDFENAVLQAVKQIPCIKESGLNPELNDLIFGGRLGMDSFDFAELVVILETATGRDPFSKDAHLRGSLRTLRDLARLYSNA